MDSFEKNRAPDVPLQRALREKNRSAARKILSEMSALPRGQAADCALLTLGWAPELLETILEKTQGGPFAWLRHEVTLDAQTQLTLSLRGSLVMIAAALDDLPALNLLLSRGGHPDYDFRRDRWEIAGDLLMGGVTMGALNSPEYSLECSRPFPDDSSNVLPSADPLSAAIFCNAKSCAARLLEEPSVTVTPAVRRALARTPVNETQTLVAQRLDTPLAELLQPEDFGPEMDHPLLQEVLERHGGKLPRKNVEGFVSTYGLAEGAERARQREIFGLMDADLLGDVVWEAWQQNSHCRPLLELADALALPVDRCRVSERLHRDLLTELMEHFCITGDAPEEGLSGLACALLHLLEADFQTRPMPVEQLLQLPGAARVLETERPEMMDAWLAAHPGISASQSLPLKALLDIHTEVSYEL